MRIGMMVDMYKPHISGVTHYVSLNKRALEAAGHEVEVFTFGGEGTVDDEPGIAPQPRRARRRIGFLSGLPLQPCGAAAIAADGHRPRAPSLL